MNAELRPDVTGFPRSTPLETAISWVSWLGRHPEDVAARTACAAWRKESIEHDEAFKRAERTWRAMGEVSDHPVLAAWRESARTARMSRRPWLAAAALATVALLAGGTLWLNGRPGTDRSPMPTAAATHVTDSVPHPGEYRIATTRLGERQQLVLEDGTRVTLNTASRLEIDYRGSLRRVNLLAGEAMFRVAKNPNRAFVVTAGNRQVVALGTAFGVRLDGAAVQVTLLEGHVAVAPARTPVDIQVTSADAVVLAPGQQLREVDSETPTVRAVDAEHALSWEDGWLVFDNDTLARAIQEVSRYTQERIVYDDPRFATLRVSGTMRTGQVEDLIDALTRVYPLDVQRISPDTLRLVWQK
jgi:transmembrane sensor